MGRAVIHLPQQAEETGISEISETAEAAERYRSHFLTR